MIALFFIMIASLGLMLNWPAIDRALFAVLTRPVIPSAFLISPDHFSPGLLRPDGLLLLTVVFIFILASFRHTTRVILRLRGYSLLVINGLLGVEMVMSLSSRIPFFQFTGLIYSLLFTLIALIASLIRIGSQKSLQSYLVSDSRPESQVFSRTFSSFFPGGGTNKIQIRASDGDQTAVFSETDSIKIGREAGWADLLVDPKWNRVSNRHGIIRVVGNSLFYEPLAEHYPYEINGIPQGTAAELQDGDRLSPVTGVELFFSIRKVREIRTADRHRLPNPKVRVLKDEYRKLGFTMKLFVILLLLALPLLFGMIRFQQEGQQNWNQGNLQTGAGSSGRR